MRAKEIDKHLSCIEDSLHWVEKHLSGDKKEKSYAKLVDQRRYLKKIKFALDDNPAAAIYGESQKGKSYLVSSLLSSPKKPFSVIDANRNEYDFKLDINPLGQDQESTSVVTRFSSNYNWEHDDYPVKVQLLSVVDILLLLSDTYYNDLNNHSVIPLEDLDQKVKDLESKYQSSSHNQSVLNEDDIFDIRDYFQKHFQANSFNVLSSDYFKILSRIINKIPVDSWADTFSVLWNNNNLVVELFKKLIHKFEDIDFVDCVYVPYKAVLREYGTLLDVNRLIEINSSIQGSEVQYEADSKVYYRDAQGNEVQKTLKKSFLCALTAEIIFKLPKELQEEKKFLTSTDLLDFPGARARLDNNEDDISEEEIPKMLVRGKVAYLFNKYSDNYKINTLLFCHDKIQAAQRYMPNLLNDWVTSTLGGKYDERSDFISNSQIAPLFIISTKFNQDLKIGQADSQDIPDALNHRWGQRFSKVLQEELINVDMFDWFEKWTSENEPFKNIYLLRDYYYSSEEQDQLFVGFNESGIEKEEAKPPTDYPNFKEDLKNSFLNHSFVKTHFKDPEKSWDEAASMNKDGTDLIIENLTIAVNNINKARESRFNRVLKDLSENLAEDLKKHYHSGDSDDLLKKAKENAGRIQSKLDVSFGRDPYFFGEMMKGLMISEGKVYNHYRNIINDLETKSDIKFNEHSTIRIRVPELSNELDFKTNLEVLSKAYEFSSIEECQKHFEELDVDLEELFYGQLNKIKLFSTELAESLKTYWLNESRDNLIPKGSNKFGLNSADFEEIFQMMDLLYKKLNLTSRIANVLASYIDRYDKVDEVLEMISDISAEIINKFVNEVGYTYYELEDLKVFRDANDNNNLGLQFDHDYLMYEGFKKDDIAELFESIDNLPKLFNEDTVNENYLKMIPSYGNYKKWYDRLKLGFVAVCDIPNYDVNANEELGRLKESIQEISY